MDKQITIALTLAQAEALFGMIDAAVKARGLQGAGTAVEIATILQAAVNSPLCEPEPAPLKEAA